MIKTLLLTTAGVAAFSSLSFGQTSLFSEDFEGGAGAFTLNTTTQGGMSGLTGDNAWVVNNSYTGGSGTSSCFGLSFTIGTTPSQPAGISSQNGNYLHILSDDGTSNGILNANYAAADGSFCFFAESYFAEMTADISTVGYTSVTLDFWYMCGGAPTQAYGEVYYSTDAGSTWTLITSPISQYSGVTNWTNQLITNAAWDNQATLRFGFRYNNGVASTGSEPSFSIDDVEITGTTGGGGSNSLSTGTSLSPTQWCQGTAQAMNVDFTSTGTFNAGNVYSAELSDASGSFASPTVIGTLSSTANSGTISATIPGGTPAGAGYRIRVVSDNPATTGADNGADLTINAAPTVTLQQFSDVCSTSSAFALSGGSPAGGVYSGTGVSGGNFDPSVSGVGTFTITYDYTDGNGCSGSATQSITVTNGVTVTQQPFTDVCSGGGVVTLVGGSPVGGTYTGTGVSGTNFDPSVSGLGTFTITYSYDDGNGCSGSVTEPITVIQSPTVTLDPFSNVCDDDPFFTITGGTPSNGTYTGNGVTGGVFDPSAAGVGTHTITYTFTDANGCSGTATSSITVEQCGGINDVKPIAFTIQPNPATETFVINSENAVESVVLLDMSGRVVKEYSIAQDSFNVKDVPSGVYFVRAAINGQMTEQRIVIQ